MTVRIGLIGAGRIGRKHAETVSRLSTAVLAAVADADEGAAATAAGFGGDGTGVAVVTDYRRLLDDPAIDAVVIAAPTDLHAALIAAAAAAGKQIFCEKPIALTVAEADEALAAVARAGVQPQPVQCCSRKTWQCSRVLRGNATVAPFRSVGLSWAKIGLRRS